jgi:hypothetical protein
MKILVCNFFCNLFLLKTRLFFKNETKKKPSYYSLVSINEYEYLYIKIFNLFLYVSKTFTNECFVGASQVDYVESRSCRSLVETQNKQKKTTLN